MMGCKGEKNTISSIHCRYRVYMHTSTVHITTVRWAHGPRTFLPTTPRIVRRPAFLAMSGKGACWRKQPKVDETVYKQLDWVHFRVPCLCRAHGWGVTAVSTTVTTRGPKYKKREEEKEIFPSHTSAQVPKSHRKDQLFSSRSLPKSRIVIMERVRFR